MKAEKLTGNEEDAIILDAGREDFIAQLERECEEIRLKLEAEESAKSE